MNFERVAFQSASCDFLLSIIKKDLSHIDFFFRTAFSFLLDFLITVDLLAHVFDVLRNDLKSDIAKELFLYYQATPVVLQYLKPVNKVISSTTSNCVLKGDNSSKKNPFLFHSLTDLHGISNGHIPSDVHRLTISATVSGNMQYRDMVQNNSHGAEGPEPGQQTTGETQHHPAETLQIQVSIYTSVLAIFTFDQCDFYIRYFDSYIDICLFYTSKHVKLMN